MGQEKTGKMGMSIIERLRRLISDAKEVWNAPGGKRPFSARYRAYEKSSARPEKSRAKKNNPDKDPTQP